MRSFLALALLLPGSALACAMPRYVEAPPSDPKLLVDIGPGAQLEALFRSIEDQVMAPAAPPAGEPKTTVAPPTSMIPEVQAPVVPEA